MQSKREGLVGLIIELSKIFYQYQEKCIPDVLQNKNLDINGSMDWIEAES